MNTNLIEAIGYLGSVLVLVSFLMSSVVKLRVINTIGGVIFSTYAFIIHSYPTAIMNVALVCINLYYLWKLRNSEPNYKLVQLEPGESFVRFFLDDYGKDIAACFPGREIRPADVNRAFLVCHGAEPAGLLLGREKDGVLDIALDYTTPVYRDASVGRYLLEHLPSEGLKLLRYSRAEEKHLPFLQKMGYEDKNGVFEKTL